MNDNKNDLPKLRHSAAHLLAHAIKELYPNTLLTIGPATKEGFFYDFLPEKNFKLEDLPAIEKRMHEIADRNLPITHTQIPKDKAREIFAGNPFKLELIEQIPDNTVGLSQQGDFYDLCRGGHVDSTGEIKHFTLLGISGAYWRADKKNAALQRISGTAFYSQEDLDEYLARKEQAAQFDHRKLGKQLDFFSFHPEAIGFPFFHPKGKIILNELTNYLRKLQTQHNYQEISTPMLLNDELWKRSGHYAFYKDNMYFCDIDDETYAIKPMNCPGAFLLYNERPHSYRELPLRLSEFGLVHRHELSGVLHGLLRVRAFTQDDAHIMCSVEQLETEIQDIIELTYAVLKRFDFPNIKVALSTKPESAMGSDELWHKAEKALENALKKSNLEYTIQEGEGAFYGPKIEFKILDSMKREWQCGTIQVDFFQPENFDLTYVASSGKKKRPVIIHRAIYGSLERFFAILLEHYKGNLPFWLAPVQIKILTITDAQKDYAASILDILKKQHLRAEMDTTSDPISGQIKNAQMEKIPWMLVLGKKEEANNTITLRYFDGKQEFNLSIDDILQKAHELQK
ncbi:MAG: threonine--tRNA ligase [Candidatus Babeliales bacterium]